MCALHKFPSSGTQLSGLLICFYSSYSVIQNEKCQQAFSDLVHVLSRLFNRTTLNSAHGFVYTEMDIWEVQKSRENIFELILIYLIWYLFIICSPSSFLQ